MSTLFVFKFSQVGPHPVARVSLQGEDIVVDASEKTVAVLLGYALRRPAMVSTRSGTDLVKTWPKNRQEAMEARLKRFLHRPYFLSRTRGAEDHFDIHEAMPAQVLDLKEAA